MYSINKNFLVGKTSPLYPIGNKYLTRQIQNPKISVDQEILFIFGNREFLMFDIITKKELTRKRIPFMSNILKVYAEKCTPNCGIYIINDNGVLYDLSWKNGELIFRI